MNPTRGDPENMGPAVAGIFLTDVPTETHSFQGEFEGYLLHSTMKPAAERSTHLAFQILPLKHRDFSKRTESEKQEIARVLIALTLAAKREA